MIQQKLTIPEIAMILTCIGALATTSQTPVFLAIVAIVWLIPLMLLKPTNSRHFCVKVNDQRMIKAFVGSFAAYMCIQVYLTLAEPNIVYTRLGLIHVVITSTIFIAYAFGVKHTDFNWGITWKEALFVVLMFILMREIVLFAVMGKAGAIVSYMGSFAFLRNIGIHLLYPSIVEEVLFRGLFLTGLIAVGVREDLSNIAQALVFGFIHVIGKGSFTVQSVLSCFVQVYIGFIFGKIYLSTKSLTPTLLLHALFDAFHIPG